MDYNIKISGQFLQVIGDALSNAPYKFSAPVIAELQKQVNEQDAARALNSAPPPIGE